MERCSICNKDLSRNETVIFIGYTNNNADRFLHEDTIIMHSDCCPSYLVQNLEEELIYH